MPLNERSLNNLAGVQVPLVRVTTRAAELCQVPFVVTEGLRNLERQKKLKAAGKSWTLDSRHLTGHAVDVVDADDFGYDIPDMEEIAKAFKAASAELKIPIEWGGDWKTRDTPHFELDRKAYPASGISLTAKAKEVATNVVLSKTGQLVIGAGTGAAAATAPVPAPSPPVSLPSPPDLSPVLAWKGFGETLAGLWSFGWANIGLTALLIAIIAILAYGPKVQKP